MPATTDCPDCRKARLLALGVLAGIIGDAGELAAVTVGHWRDRSRAAGVGDGAWPGACAGLLASGAVKLVVCDWASSSMIRVVLGGAA